MTALQSSPDGAPGVLPGQLPGQLPSVWACIAPGAGSRRLEAWLHLEQHVLISQNPGGDGTNCGGRWR